MELAVRLCGTSPAGNAEHGVLIGAGQSGKSTAALALLGRCRNLVVIDPKRAGQFDGLGGVVGEDPELILRHPVVIWQPPMAAITRPAKDWSDPWSRGLWYIRSVRSRRGVCVFHDEARVTLPTAPHPLAAEQVHLGMGLGIGVWAATQGFSRTYPPLFDNAVHWLLFRLASASQRGSLAASLEVEGLVNRLGGLPPRRFLYWRQGMLEATGPHDLGALGRRRGRPPASATGTAISSDGATAGIGQSDLTTSPVLL